MSLVIISVDEPEDSLPWAEKKGITVPLGSDPKLELIRRFGLENPDVPELSLHAVYLVDEEGVVFYRKVARRRAYSPEFLDAIDYHYRDRDGRWPRAATKAQSGDSTKG